MNKKSFLKLLIGGLSSIPFLKLKSISYDAVEEQLRKDCGYSETMPDGYFYQVLITNNKLSDPCFISSACFVDKNGNLQLYKHQTAGSISFMDRFNGEAVKCKCVFIKRVLPLLKYINKV
jgi:hypothetical protein